jgi:hypothetical protein
MTGGSLVARQNTCPPRTYECPSGGICCPNGSICLEDNLCSVKCPPGAPKCGKGCCTQGTCGTYKGDPVCVV